LFDLSFVRGISPSRRGAGHHIWSSRIYKTHDIDVIQPKWIKKAKYNDLKIDLRILPGQLAS
jgi:hypothetical protein